MIPYFTLQAIHIGPITLHVWGMFVALGFLTGAFVAARYAKSRGDDPKIIYDLAVWMAVAGTIGGRLGHVLFYEFPFYAAHPLEIFAIWHGGMSMFGGLIACGVVGVWFLRHRNVDVWRYTDTAAFGLPFGIAIGRVGCFLIHDHPGTATDFFLGVQYPDGVVRHDHGLYEVLNGVAMSIVFLLIFHFYKKSKGSFLISHYSLLFSIWYGIFRLIMDAYRIVDTRYFGLTPGQYLGALLAIFGVIGLVWINRRQKVREVLK